MNGISATESVQVAFIWISENSWLGKRALSMDFLSGTETFRSLADICRLALPFHGTKRIYRCLTVKCRILRDQYVVVVFLKMMFCE